MLLSERIKLRQTANCWDNSQSDLPEEEMQELETLEKRLETNQAVIKTVVNSFENGILTYEQWKADLAEIKRKADNWDRVCKAKQVRLYFEAFGIEKKYIEIGKQNDSIFIQSGSRVWPEREELVDSLDDAMNKLSEAGL